MTEVGPADRSRLLRSKRDEISSIVTSRKRKLRQLFAVATEGDALPTNDFANPDAPPATAAELQFLQRCDISQGRKLSEANLPARPQLRYDVLRQSLDNSGLFAPEPAPVPPAKQDAVLPKPQTKTAPAPSPKPAAPAPSDLNGTAPEPRTPATFTLPPSLPPKPPTPVPAAATPNRPGASKPPTLAASGPPPPSPVAAPTKNPLHASREGATEKVEIAAVEKPAPTPLKENPNGIPKKAEPRKGDAPQAVSSQPVAKSPAAQLPARPDFKKAEETAPVAAKPPPETAKVADGLSSPGSTTQTAATPAVHDASTDTSPDNEGPQYVERAETSNEGEAAERAEEAKGTEGGASPDADSLNGRIPDGPEAQLLQESMAMGSKPTPPVIATRASPPATPVPPPDEVKAAEPTTAESATPSVAQSATPTPAVPPTAQSVKEIPDSQESQAPEKMDVDQPDVDQTGGKPSVEVQDAPVEPSQAETQTPKALNQAPQTPQDPDRAVTRTASGTIRQKSVAEILGEATPETQVATKMPASQLTPLTSTPQSPPSRPKTFANKKRDKEKARNKPSEVVFGKQTKRSADKSLVPSQQKQSFLPTDDYFTPLFVQGFTQTSKWMKPIEVILNQSHKTVSTPDAYVAIQDNQACRVLRRVYHLQQHDKWSLRQPKRCPEPIRPESHWDVLLQEMKWMRTDFREEKKWKLAAARNLAHACAEWAASSEEERKELQVSAYIPPKEQPAEPETEGDASMADISLDIVDAHATPELVSSGDLDSPEHVDELREEVLETVAPSAIFALEDDDVVFELRSSPTADQLLQELPMYGTPLKIPAFDFTVPEFDPDAHWRRPALPLSKYVEGEMKLSSDGPPRKRSRYQYEEEEEDDDEKVVFGSQPAKTMKLQPQNADVALFNPEMKSIRDRLHAGHQFRPPAEYQMPMQSFYECRSPSQWTLAEDDELRSLVREYSYNWSLISSLLTPRSLFTSGAERRTPWECFERWINLEGLPTDMQKTQYFKAYQNRIDAANRVIMQQNQIAQQQAAGSTAPATPVARRRPSTPLRVERRRNQKHLTLIDAMRKLAKKRETAAQKQQHATQMAAMRKANEAAQPRGPTKTPRDYSLMRWERDQQLAEKVAQFHQRQEAQRRITMQQRGQVAAQIATTPAAGQVPAGAAGQVNGNMARPNMPNQLAVPGQAGRGRMPMQAPTANMGGVPAQMSGLVPPMPMNGVQTAQMQAALQAQHRMPMPNPQPDVNLMMQARRISEQQRQAVQLQQAQQQVQQQVHQQQPQQQQQQQQQQHQQQQQQQQQPQPQQPAQQQQQGQQLHQGTPTSHASQSHSPPNMRPASVNGVHGANGVNGVNGVNQQSFIANAQANAQAMMAFNAANSGGVATSPAGGLHMPNGTSGSPRPLTQVPAGIQQQLSNLENQYRLKNPSWTPELVRQHATEHLTRLMIHQRTTMSQNAMNAAAGGGGASSPGIVNGIAATTSPHQYAALLRQQQQQQAAAAAAQNGQPQNGQHQQAHQQHHGQQQAQQHHQQNGQQQHVQPQHIQHQQHQARPQSTTQPQHTPQPPQSQQLPKQTHAPQQAQQAQQIQRPQSAQSAQALHAAQLLQAQKLQQAQKAQQAQQAQHAQQAQKPQQPQQQARQTPQVQQVQKTQQSPQVQQAQKAQQSPQVQQAQKAQQSPQVQQAQKAQQSPQVQQASKTQQSPQAQQAQQLQQAQHLQQAHQSQQAQPSQQAQQSQQPAQQKALPQVQQQAQQQAQQAQQQQAQQAQQQRQASGSATPSATAAS
ncbi:hypothetical protein CORC01_09201 [Colletotrichum orchidophilum]|uniref:Vacuolar import and degradation protein 21 n=1 Tax=Colletotrichum orchidophilum TaxID=1209926 RepID=A0A1G4B213_9PEZI|nr:uncharacterized protein CORC01_09201 [Colletotrichum orchidophilum]OHE95468.1 hypothetical protein CORC01_09201 [Colletotrichum orchidophilum]